MCSVPCGARRHEVDACADEDAGDAECGCEKSKRGDDDVCEGQYFCRREPCGGSERSEREEEEAEEEDLAREPGAAPHFECAPSIGRPAEVKDGDVEREDGEGEDECECDGADVVRDERCGERADGELDERGHPDK